MRVRAALAVGTALATVAAGASRSATPPIRPDYDIYSIGASGGTPTRLTTDTADDLSPSLSRDGKTIVFSRGSDLWLMSSDGANQRLLLAAPQYASYLRPSWSPNGRWIAFILRDDSACYPVGVRCAWFSLWIVRPDGSQLHELRSGVESAQWARDRNLLAAAGRLAHYNLEAHAVYAMSPSGKGTLVTEVKNSVTSPALSPHGRLVAYGRGPSFKKRTVAWIARVDLKGRRSVGYGTNPSWSPSGRLVTFSDHGDVYLVRARGMARPKHLAFGDWTSWSPRGDRLALLDWRLAVIRPNGHFYHVLCCEQHFGFGQDAPAWSSGGDRIFYAFKATDVPPA